MIRLGTGGQQPSADDDVRTLTGSRLDTYLRVIRAQANDAAQAAKDETARFAHETFANLIERERAMLQKEYSDRGLEPRMVFDGHGLPHIQAFRTYTNLLKADSGQFDDVLSSATKSYEQIEGDDWIKRIRKDRIAKRETQVVLSTGSHDGLEVRVIECAYRDGVDKIGRTTPFYIRNAVTEYQIAFGELFWRQKNEHLVVRAATKALVKSAVIKKYDDLSFRYELKNRHLDTPVVGIFRRHRKPRDYDVRSNCVLNARTRLEENLLHALRPLFEPSLRIDETWIKFHGGFKTALRYGETIIGTLYRFNADYHNNYPWYTLDISGEHLKDDHHISRIRTALAKKRIVP